MMIFILLAGMLGYEDGSAPGAILAVVLVHLIIAGYVYVAWLEGLPENVKKD